MGSPRQLPLGIQGLDGVLGGGIPEGTTALVLGPSGNPEHTFLMQIAGQGLNDGERVLWVEADRPGVSLEEELAPFVRSREEGHIDTLHVARVGSPAPTGVDSIAPSDFPLELTRRLLEGPGYNRVIISSLTSLRASLDEETISNMLGALSDAIRATRSIAAIYGVEPAHPLEVVSRWRHQCGAVFRFGVEQRGFGLYQFLVVEKVLGLSEVLRMLPLSENEFGLRFETARRV